MLGLAAIGVGYDNPNGSQPVTTGCTGLHYGNGFVYGYFTSGGDDQVFAQMDATCNGNYYNVAYPSDCTNAQPAFVVEDTSGKIYSFPTGFHSFSSNLGSYPPIFAFPAQIEDRNGNIISFSTNGGPPNVTDSLGRAIISEGAITGSSANYTIGGLAYTLGYDTSLQAHFTVASTQVGPPPDPSFGGCTFNGGLGFSGKQALRSITLPNGQAYRFDYDSTYGLLRKIHITQMEGGSNTPGG